MAFQGNRAPVVKIHKIISTGQYWLVFYSDTGRFISKWQASDSSTAETICNNILMDPVA